MNNDPSVVIDDSELPLLVPLVDSSLVEDSSVTEEGESRSSPQEEMPLSSNSNCLWVMFSSDEMRAAAARCRALVRRLTGTIGVCFEMHPPFRAKFT
jgi:hypothetical protein